MMPPCCRICKGDFDPGDGAGLVYFQKTESDHAWDRRMQEEGMVGHPPYAAWYCKTHFEAAEELSHLPRTEASAQLREWFPNG